MAGEIGGWVVLSRDLLVRRPGSNRAVIVWQPWITKFVMVGCAEWAVSRSECRQRIKKWAVKNQRLEQARRLIGSRSEYGGARRLAKTNYAITVARGSLASHFVAVMRS